MRQHPAAGTGRMVRCVGDGDVRRLISSDGSGPFFRALAHVLAEDFRRREALQEAPRGSPTSADGVVELDPSAIGRITRHLKPHGFRIVPTRSAAEALEGADLVTTAPAGTRGRLAVTTDMVEDGTHIDVVGGRLPGRTALASVNRRRKLALAQTWCSRR